MVNSCDFNQVLTPQFPVFLIQQFFHLLLLYSAAASGNSSANDLSYQKPMTGVLTPSWLSPLPRTAARSDAALCSGSRTSERQPESMQQCCQVALMLAWIQQSPLADALPTALRVALTVWEERSVNCALALLWLPVESCWMMMQMLQQPPTLDN